MSKIWKYLGFICLFWDPPFPLFPCFNLKTWSFHKNESKSSWTTFLYVIWFVWIKYISCSTNLKLKRTFRFGETFLTSICILLPTPSLKKTQSFCQTNEDKLRQQRHLLSPRNAFIYFFFSICNLTRLLHLAFSVSTPVFMCRKYWVTAVKTS